jgi:zinc protease
LEPREGTAVLRGRVATRNDMVGATLEIIRTEMQKMADGHLDQGELDDAKSFMVAAHLLSPVSNRTVAAELLRYSVLGFSPDFVKNIHSLIRRVNLSDAKRVASYLLDPENLIISIAGTPSLQPART